MLASSYVSLFFTPYSNSFKRLKSCSGGLVGQLESVGLRDKARVSFSGFRIPDPTEVDEVAFLSWQMGELQGQFFRIAESGQDRAA
jgi:hypothetical protein